MKDGVVYSSVRPRLYTSHEFSNENILGKSIAYDLSTGISTSLKITITLMAG